MSHMRPSPGRWHTSESGGFVMIEWTPDGWAFRDEWGCFEYGFASEESALEAECNHDCQGMKA